MKARWWKSLAAVFAAAVLAAGSLVPVMAEEAATEAVTEAAGEEGEDEENYLTGDASLDDPLNQDDIGEKEILVLSFGTSYNYSRYMTNGGIERAIAAAYPDWSVRRGFTANIIIDHVASRDGEIIDDVDQALQRAVDNGVKELIVCCTHLMEGHEYNDIIDSVLEYQDSFESVGVTRPLFGMNDSLELDPIIEIITSIMTNYVDGETAIVYMGHGTDADSDADYGALQEALTAAGYDNYYITTVESETWNTERVLSEMEGKGYTKVVLRPLMVVAGDHAHNDMAGLEDDTIRSMFEAAGYETDCILDGLGQVPEIQQLYVDRVQEVLDQM